MPLTICLIDQKSGRAASPTELRTASLARRISPPALPTFARHTAFIRQRPVQQVKTGLPVALLAGPNIYRLNCTDLALRETF